MSQTLVKHFHRSRTKRRKRRAATISKVLESKIQRDIVKRAKSFRSVVFKLVGVGFKGWPDLLIARDGYILLIEVKRPKGKRSPSQFLVAKALATAGIIVHEIDNVDDADALFTRYFGEPSS